MTALEEIKKPLEGKDIATLTNVELVTEISRLLSEVERLRQFLFPYADRTDISGISWDGKYLIGDKASIKAFHEMKNRGEQIDVYKRAYDQNEAALKAEAEYLRGVANDIQKGYIEATERAEEAVTAANALQVRTDAAEAKVTHLRDALAFYANPEIYKPHPHGPAFDRRDLSYHARTALASTGGEHNAE